MRCPQCTLNNLASAAHCVHCGFQLRETTGVTDQPSAAELAAQQYSVEEIEGAIAKRQSNRRTTGENVALLALSLLAFIAVERSPSLQVTSLLVAVIGLHELGHFVGMQVFGYRDVHMFFIPFLGAATAGVPTSPSGTRRAIVALLGPLPGIVLGVVCLGFYARRGELIWTQAARAFLIINIFNCLPFYPLDGGRFLDCVLLWRLPAAEVIIKAGGIATLAYFSWGMGGDFSALWLILLLGMLRSLPVTYRDALIAQSLRRGDRYLGQGERIPPDFIQAVAERLQPNQVSVEVVAARVRDIWQRVSCVLPGVSASTALLLVDMVGVVIGATALAVIVADPRAKAVAHNNAGTTLLQQGKLDTAIAELREATRLQPSELRPHMNLAAAFQRRGDFDDAVNEYREAIRIDSHSVEAHFSLGRCLEQRGDLEHATEELAEAVRLRPRSAVVHANLGRVLERRGRREDAIREYRDAIRLDSHVAEAGPRLRALEQPDSEAQ